MTKQEIDNWMRDAEFVDSIVSDQDRDNEYETHIYKREEQLYAIYFCNGYVSEYIAPCLFGSSPPPCPDTV